MTDTTSPDPRVPVELEPLTSRERKVASVFWLGFAGSLILAGTHVIGVFTAVGVMGATLSVLGVLLVLNVGRMREHGLTMSDLNRRLQRWCYQRLPGRRVIRPYLRFSWWLERRLTFTRGGSWWNDPARVGRARLIESVGMLAIGVLFLAAALGHTT